ncbi:MAG TPA: hypothetical protein VGE94_16640 [Chloroflexota bacterium]
MSGDTLPTVLGILLVAAAAAFALLPFARGSRSDVLAGEGTQSAQRFALYRQVLELEFDYHMGKLSADDYATQSADLLSAAGAALRDERGSIGEVDAEIEQEIAAARAAFAAARKSSTRTEAPTPS